MEKLFHLFLENPNKLALDLYIKPVPSTMRMKLILVFFSIFILWAFTEGESDDFIILYTSNINGVLRDCGCGEEKLGGFARLKTVIDQYRKTYKKVYLIDTGDQFTSYYYPEKNRFVYELMRDLNYDFILQADQDIASGELIEKKSNFYEENKTLFNFFIPINSYEFLADSLRKKQKERSFLTKSPFLIFHADSASFENHKNTFREKRFIFLSHSQELHFERKEKRFFFQSGMDTEYLGIATFREEDGEYRFKANTFLHLDSTIQEDKSFKQRIDRFFTEMEHSPPPYRSEHNEEFQLYLTADNCKQCHESEYAKWKQSNHAHAFETLKRENRAFDSDCISCHTTGYKRGGYRDYISSKSLIDVQCEACHQNLPINHQKAEEQLKYQKVAEETCLNCHTAKNSPKFNYPLYLSKIIHWKSE